MSRADGGWPVGMMEGHNRSGKFPWFPIHSKPAGAYCAKCERLLAAVVVHPHGLAIVARTTTRTAAGDEYRRVREAAGRDAARYASGVGFWAEWLDDLDDLSPADGWCPTHGRQPVDIARIVSVVRPTP